MVNSQLFDAKEFYSRQVVLPEFGSQGQEKLKRAKVAVVGIGGLGSVSAFYLALAGTGYLRLVDQDTVELRNLHRQILYDLDALRYPKVEAAAKRIQKTNPEVNVEPIPENARESNIEDIVRGMDCVVDGLDNMRTRYLLNRACVKLGIPYIFGAAVGMEGNLSVFTPPETPCLECILPNIDDKYLPTCETRGVLGATTGIIGALQSMEAIKLLVGIKDTLKAKLMVCDFSDMYFATIQISKRPNCHVCQEKTVETVARKESLVWLCGHNAVNINPPTPMDIPLNQIYEVIKRHFRIIIKSALVIVFDYGDGIEVSFFSRGRMLVKNVKDEDSATEIYNHIIEKIKPK